MTDERPEWAYLWVADQEFRTIPTLRAFLDGLDEGVEIDALVSWARPMTDDEYEQAKIREAAAEANIRRLDMNTLRDIVDKYGITSLAEIEEADDE